MKFILGKKLGMSQMFDGRGNVTPVTVLEAGPCFVTQVRTVDVDGYDAIQIGYGIKKLRNITKALRGHLQKVKNSNFDIEKNAPRWLREFALKKCDLKLGDEINVSLFAEGDKIRVCGFSKGKGFQGVVKRHGFAGGPASHGHRHVLRTPGSIGSRFPQHTRKGRRMAGHAGYEKMFIKNLKIMNIDKDKNTIAIKGSVPGYRGTLLEITQI